MLKHKKTNTLTSNKQKEENSNFPVDKPGRYHPNWVKVIIIGDNPCWYYVPLMSYYEKGASPLWHFFPNPKPQADHEKTEKSTLRGIPQNIWPEPFKSIKVMEGKKTGIVIEQRTPRGRMTTHTIVPWLSLTSKKRWYKNWRDSDEAYSL